MAGERSDLGKIFITPGGDYDATVTYETLTMVKYNNSLYLTLRTVTGVTPSDDRVNYLLMAQGFTATRLESITATDVQGLVTEPGDEMPAQTLINAIADRVANQLVSNSDLQDILSDYILKSAITNNLSITEEGKVLDARQGKALNDAKANMAAVTTGSLNDITKSGNYYLTSNVSGKPTTEGGIYLFSSLADNSVRAGIFYSPYKTDAGLNVVYSLNGTEFVNKTFGVFSYTVSGTTSTTGAIMIPTELQGKILYGFAPTNFTGFVVQRDQSYFTVFKNDLSGPLANTSVSFIVYYSYLSS